MSRRRWLVTYVLIIGLTVTLLSTFIGYDKISTAFAALGPYWSEGGRTHTDLEKTGESFQPLATRVFTNESSHPEIHQFTFEETKTVDATLDGEVALKVTGEGELKRLIKLAGEVHRALKGHLTATYAVEKESLHEYEVQPHVRARVKYGVQIHKFRIHSYFLNGNCRTSHDKYREFEVPENGEAWETSEDPLSPEDNSGEFEVPENGEAWETPEDPLPPEDNSGEDNPAGGNQPTSPNPAPAPKPNPTPTPTPRPDCPPMLASGSTGSWVKVLQRELNARGMKDQDGKALVVDGRFGPRTRYAVESWQKHARIQVDGIVGPITWHTLGKC